MFHAGTTENRRASRISCCELSVLIFVNHRRGICTEMWGFWWLSQSILKWKLLVISSFKKYSIILLREEYGESNVNIGGADTVSARCDISAYVLWWRNVVSSKRADIGVVAGCCWQQNMTLLQACVSHNCHGHFWIFASEANAWLTLWIS
jgi:hypothetical protein